MGFWVGESLNPNWCRNIRSHWMPKGSLMRYLGCRARINLPLEAHIQPLLLSLGKKLIFRSSKNLPFAGRLVVSNQVLFFLMCYVVLLLVLFVDFGFE